MAECVALRRVQRAITQRNEKEAVPLWGLEDESVQKFGFDRKERIECAADLQTLRSSVKLHKPKTPPPGLASIDFSKKQNYIKTLRPVYSPPKPPTHEPSLSTLEAAAGPPLMTQTSLRENLPEFSTTCERVDSFTAKARYAQQYRDRSEYDVAAPPDLRVCTLPSFVG
jgi:hypothetical protein